MDAVERASARGNHVRAALLRARTDGLDAAAPHLELVAAGLEVALALEPPASERIRGLLRGLVRSVVARRARWRERLSVEAHVLWALQGIAADARPAPTVDLVEWLRALGRHPMARVRPAQSDLRRVRRLEAVVQRLDRARVGSPEAAELADLLVAAAERRGDAFCARWREPFDAVLARAGLDARDPAELAARRRIVDELLDLALFRGHFDFTNLRDAIARSPLKLADFPSLRAWLRGDPLLRADAALVSALDGVYDRGELYLRGLHRAQGLLFGTETGRQLSRWALLPVGGAAVALEFFGYLLGPLGLSTGLTSVPSVLALALVLATLVNFPTARARLGAAGRRVHAAIVGRSLARSTAGSAAPPRAGRLAALVADLATGLAVAYASVVARLESVVHVGDEWLRYRGAARRWAERVRAFAGLVWFVVGYGLRFALRVVVEPSVNPIKHFPVVTVAGKVSIATGVPVLIALSFARVTSEALAATLGFVLGVLVLPGICGFVAWEVRYEWQLFGLGRPRRLPAAAVGPHRESLARLLLPGVYSGAVPRTFSRWDRAVARQGPASAEALRWAARRRDLTVRCARFFQRELLERWRASRAGRHRELALHVELEPASARCTLACRAGAGGPLVIELRVRERVVAAIVTQRGFAAALSPGELRVLEAALLGCAASAGATELYATGAHGVAWDAWRAFWAAEERGTPPPLLDGVTLLADSAD
jgi:hypothetical protein